MTAALTNSRLKLRPASILQLLLGHSRKGDERGILWTSTNKLRQALVGMNVEGVNLNAQKEFPNGYPSKPSLQQTPLLTALSTGVATISVGKLV